MVTTPQARAPAAEVWLATPVAALLFDPSSLGAADRAVWDGLHTARRREDWASSRALLAAVPGADGHASSLSHSRGFAALARAPGRVAVGVDVEWLSRRDFLSMARMAYAPAEADELASLEDATRLRDRFYEAWTLKEAFAKALRLRLADALGQCRFNGADDAAAARVPTTRPWSATVFAPRPQLRLAVVLVADDSAAVPTVLRTLEWPPGHAVTWPVVRRLACAAGAGVSAATC
jgi:phosphopantetheinyl transferase (holo-ACP synthase)